MHECKSRRFRSDGKSLKSLSLPPPSPPRVFFYRSRFLLRDNRVLNGLLGTFYPNLSPLRNVSLIYDGGLRSLIHQPFTGMVNPVWLGFTAMGSTLFVPVWETQRKPMLTIRTFLASFTPPWCVTITSWIDNCRFFFFIIIYLVYWSIKNIKCVLYCLPVSL